VDEVAFDGVPAVGEVRGRVVDFLDLVRKRAGRAERAAVHTSNTVPTGAGLASSASGFAALAVASAAAYGLDVDATALSRLARRGSGSAARSIFGGFVIWYAGTDDAADPDAASYAEPVPAPGLSAVLVVAMLQTTPKHLSSRDAMRRTVRTSPLYRSWLASSKADVDRMRLALRRGDLDVIGEIAERNALGMHEAMRAAHPPVRYLTPGTMSVLRSVRGLRRDGISAWSTMDAGPNIKVLCRGADADRVAEAVREAASCPVVIARCGPGARLKDR
jgi:diphosphomevalonate decarboxylase